MDSCNTIVSYWETTVFRGYVSFREGTPRVSRNFIEKKNLHFVHLYLMLISNMSRACKGNVGPTLLGAIFYCDFYSWNSKHHPNSEKHQVFQTFYKFFDPEELEMILNFQMDRGLRSRNRLGPAQEALLSETADLDLLGAVSIQSCALVIRYDSITWWPYRNGCKNQYAHIKLFNMWQFAYASQKNLPRQISHELTSVFTFQKMTRLGSWETFPTNLVTLRAGMVIWKGWQKIPGILPSGKKTSF